MTLNILFLGNSYTHCNTMPKMLECLCTVSGHSIQTKQVAPGGETLAGHCASPASAEALAEPGWDYVVLQEQSMRPIIEPDKMMEAAVILAERIHIVGAEPVLYLTWPRKHKPGKQKALTAAYTAAAERIKARISPAGHAWRLALEEDPSLPFYEADDHHPALLGSYAAACTFYATFTGDSPVGLPHEITYDDGKTADVNADHARIVQEAAWQAYQELPPVFQ